MHEDLPVVAVAEDLVAVNLTSTVDDVLLDCD